LRVVIYVVVNWGKSNAVGSTLEPLNYHRRWLEN
jgi:hypothetical protein